MYKYLPYFANLFPHTFTRYLLRQFLTPKRYARPKREKEVWQEGTRLNYTGFVAHAYNLAAIKKVVFLHGWAGRGSQFYAFVEPLVKADFAVILVDGPAHGDSPGSKTNLVAFTKAIVKAFKEENIYALVGHSFGGMSVLLSGQMGLKVKKRITIGSPLYTDKVISFFCQRYKLNAQTSLIFKKAVEQETKMKIKEVDAHPHFSDADYLIVHDKEDKDVGFDRALELKLTYPGSSIYTSEGLGHYRILSSSRVVKHIKKFLQS